MRIKNLLPLLLAGSLMIACTPAKQAGNSFEWGQVPQQPDLSWADSVGSRQLRSSRQYRTQHRGHSESNRQLRCLRRRNGCPATGVLPDRSLVCQKRRKPADWQRGDSACQPRHPPLSRISLAYSRDRDDMAGSSDQHCRREERCHQRRRYTGLPWKSLLG